MAKGQFKKLGVFMKIGIIPGEAIGPEITRATMVVLRAVQEKLSLNISFETGEVGIKVWEKEGTTLPKHVFEMAKSADGFILGPQDNLHYPPEAEGGRNISSDFRKYLDLYANIRPAKSYEGISKFNTPVDLVIFRENNEGFYADRNMFEGNGEFMPTEDTALAIRKITASGCRKIAKAAFEMAQERPRKKVTAVHKGNVLKITDGLFLREVRKISNDYKEVELEELIVDAMAAYLVRDPSRFDVIVTTNMFGDILSDEATEIAGSLGIAGSLNAGENHAMAQAAHGSAPDIAGLDKANPTSLILSASMLFDWLGRRHNKKEFCVASECIDRAVEESITNQNTRTADLGGSLGTQAFAKVVSENIKNIL